MFQDLLLEVKMPTKEISPLELELIDRAVKQYKSVVEENPELDNVNYLDFLLEVNPHNEHTLFVSVQNAAKSLPSPHTEKEYQEHIDKNPGVQYATRMLHGYASLQRIASAANPLVSKYADTNVHLLEADATLGDVLTLLFAEGVKGALSSGGIKYAKPIKQG